MSSFEPSDGLPPVSSSQRHDDPTIVRLNNHLDGNAVRSDSLPERIGSYRILEILGQGGMGRVYRAVQDNPTRHVALKVILPGKTTSERLRRFEHEAKILARLQHPGIAQIFEAGVADTPQGSQPFFAMEMIQGSTLTQYVRSHPLTLRDVLRLFIGVCHSVQHAHQRGIIHRDLKPANILVNASGQPKVIDFGVARLADAELQGTNQGTSPGQLVGTLRYMSPEQVQADPDEVDTRTDVYSLGLVCYELIADQLPYELKGLPLHKAAQVISDAPPKPLRFVKKTFRGDLETIVLKALEKDKARRYTGVEELAADLERFLADQPIQARPTSAVYQFKKFARRNKALVGGVIAVLFCLVLGIIGTTWWALAAKQASRETTQYAVRLAIQRGAWREALQLMDDAIAKDSGLDSVRWRFDRIRALLAVNEMQSAIQEIKALSGRDDLKEQEGPILLLRADILQGKDIPSTIAMINQARDKGLSKAEDAYARGLVAETSEDAIRAFRESLAEDRLQVRVHDMLCMVLWTLGRREELQTQLAVASALFPEDFNVKALRALLAASNGDNASAQLALNRMEGGIEVQDMAHLRVFIESLCKLCDAKNWANDLGVPDAVPLLNWMKAAADLGKFGIGGKNESEFMDDVVNLPLPPTLRRSLGRLLAAFSRAHQDDQHVAAELKSLFGVHPDGSIAYFLALQEFGSGHFDQAEHYGFAAAKVESLLPIRRQALWLAAVSQGMLGSPSRAQPDLQKRKQAVETLRDVLALAPLYPHERYIAIKMTLNADALGLARQLLDEWNRQAPDDLAAMKLQAQLELKSNAFGRAIDLARAVLQKSPDDAAMRSVLEEATRNLQSEVKSLPKK